MPSICSFSIESSLNKCENEYGLSVFPNSVGLIICSCFTLYYQEGEPNSQHSLLSSFSSMHASLFLLSSVMGYLSSVSLHSLHVLCTLHWTVLLFNWLPCLMSLLLYTVMWCLFHLVKSPCINIMQYSRGWSNTQVNNSIYCFRQIGFNVVF